MADASHLAQSLELTLELLALNRPLILALNMLAEAARLGLRADEWMATFQSRFGRAEWLQPYAQQTVEELPSKGVKKLVMMTPGFASDCVETLEEVAIGLKETFEEAGGEEFSVVPCLNDSEPSIAMLDSIVRNELKGWL